MGVFFQRFVRANAELLSTLLHTVAEKIEEAAPGRPHTASAGWQVTFKPGQQEVEMGEVTVELGDPPKTATVTFKDSAGNVTTPDEAPEWTSSDDAVATVSANEDGTTGEVTFVGAGSAIIECVATETDSSDTQSEVKAVGFVTVNTGDAVTGEITFDESS